MAEAAKRLDGVTHVTLTSGTAVNRDEGILYLGKCAQAITERTGLPVQLQFEPPVDLGVFEKLRELGVANVAMHVESLDESVRRRMTPGKAEISLVRYFEAFKKDSARTGTSPGASSTGSAKSVSTQTSFPCIPLRGRRLRAPENSILPIFSTCTRSRAAA